MPNPCYARKSFRALKPFYLFLSFVISLSIGVSCTKNTTTTIVAPENKVPIAVAGPAQSITLPHDTVTLAGSGSDPDGKIAAYLWSQVSGPSAALIVNPGSPTTIVIDSVPGTYVFQLMVTDTAGATGVDTMSVVVNPNPNPVTLTLAPADNPYEMQLVNWNGVDHSGSGAVDMPVEAWTNGGTAYTVRVVFRFDLSSIPSNATIISANLYLYSYPSPLANGDHTDANYGTNNAVILEQVTSDWTTTSINWFNPPSTNPNNAVSIPSTTQSFLDLNIDLTSMVGSMVNSNANYGFLMKLQSEVEYASRIFVSSQNTTYPDKRPKLVIVYRQ